MVDEPTFRAQSLNFLYAQFKAPSMAGSWCVCPIASNDHEPLIAHPGSYDADRCIHRNDHGNPVAASPPRERRPPYWPQSSPSPRATTSATSGKPGTPPPSAPPAGTTLTPPRPGNHPAAGGDPAPRPSASPSASPPGQTVDRQPYDAVYRQTDPRTGLCGPVGVGKSSVGYAIFQQVYRSGTKVAYVDLDQVGLCYPSPADDPHNHRVKAQNLGVVWPAYRAAGARCLIAVGGVPSREIVMTYAGKVPDTDLTLCRLRAAPECLTERVFRRGLGRGPVIPGPPASKSRQLLAGTAAEAVREARELDAADFADLCVDTDNYDVRQLARRVRERAGSWPRLTH